MNFRLKLQTWLAPVLILLLFWGIVAWRAQPAWFRGSYTTEGGVWLSQMWQMSAMNAIRSIRPDYCVFGNLVVLQISDWLNALLHGSNLDHAPSIQHHMATGYAAFWFTVIFFILKRNCGVWPALLGCVAMVLMPDLDGENRIFGEATNLGYFSALVTLFVYYDIWLRRACSRRRLAVYLLIVFFHIATSPMAGIITIAFCGLLFVREIVESWTRKAGWKAGLLRLWPHLIVVVFGLFTVIRAQVNYPYTPHEAGSTAMKSRFIEVVLVRQILYPLVLNFYAAFNDRIALAAFGVFILFVLGYAGMEWRKSRPRDGIRLSGTLLVLGVAIGMAVATAYSRQWLILRDESYGSLWPARYYIAQNMVVGAFLVLVLTRVSELFPKAKMGLIVFGTFMLTNYVLLQQGQLDHYMNQDDAAIVARRWPYQMRRTFAVQSLTGDAAAASQKSDGLNPRYTVEINIANHFMQMAPEKIEKAAATKLSAPSDGCAIAFADATRFKPDPGFRQRNLLVEDVRVIPRSGGVLVTFDARMNDVPRLGKQRGKLWLGQLSGNAKGQAYLYTIPVAQTPFTRRRDYFNCLFKVHLFFEGRWTAEDLQKQISALPCLVGASPDKYIARGIVMPAHERLAFSSLVGDDSLALLVHPLKNIYTWAFDGADLKPVNLQQHNDVLGAAVAGPEDFDEAAYLRNNPDVAGLVARKELITGRAHFDEFGWREPRQTRRYAVTLDVAGAGLTTAQVQGLSIVLNRDHGQLPSSLTCLLTGDNGQATEVRLCPPEGGGLEFRTFYLPRSIQHEPHPVRSIEIEFEGVTSPRSFHLEGVTFFQSL